MISIKVPTSKMSLAGGFEYVLFSTLLGEDFQFDYFSDGLKPPARSDFSFLQLWKITRHFSLVVLIFQEPAWRDSMC